jgi:hypothetical protein
MTTQNAMDSENDPDIHRHPASQAGKPTGAVYGDQRQGVDGACSPAQLHICFHCAGELVYPLDWSEDGPRHWRIVLRCPECESRREGVFDQTAVERLDDELDRGSSALLGDLRRMTHANMSEEIEFFVRALDAELIMPSDF